MEIKKVIINNREHEIVTNINQDEIENNDDVLFEDTVDLFEIIKEINTRDENKDE